MDQLPGEGTRRPKVSFMTGEIIPEQEEEESIVKTKERVTLEEVIADMNLMDLTQTALKKRIKSLIPREDNEFTTSELDFIYKFMNKIVKIEPLQTLTKNMKTKIWVQDKKDKWILRRPTIEDWAIHYTKDIFSARTNLENICEPEGKLNTEILLVKDKTQIGVVNLVCKLEAAEKAGIDISNLERIGNSMTTVVLEKFDYAGNPVEYNV